MDDKYECDYCTATFGDISDLEEHIVDHLRLHEKDLQVLLDLRKCPGSSETGDKGKIPLSYEVNSSVEPHRSVTSQECENSVVFQRERNLNVSIESKKHPRSSIPCCICGHALTKHTNIHTKMASKQVLMEHQCSGCSIFFETEESLANHCQERCKDFNNILQKEVNFSALTSRNYSPDLSQKEESANQTMTDGKLNNRLYKCGKCDHLCKDFNDWLTHEETHINRLPYHCVLCNANLSNYNTYVNHIEKHRYSDFNARYKLPILFECKKCHESFGNAWDLLMHDKLTHIDLHPYTCFACIRKYKSITALRNHKKKCFMILFREKIRQNLGHGEVARHNTIFNQALLKFQAIFCELKILERDIFCPICKKKEGSFPGLTHHFAGHFGFLQCVYCNESFKKNITVENHVPGNFKQFACQQCQQSSNTEVLPDLVCKRKKIRKYDPIKSRIRSQKYSKIMGLCDICGVTMPVRYLNKHKKRHRSTKPSCTDMDLHCPKCNALCESHFQLNLHQKRHHKTSDKMLCKFCQKKLSCKKSLEIHVSRLHSKKEAKYECFECKKKFVRKSELMKHSNVHMSESKPYKCDQCDAAFSQNCNLTKHKIIHTGKRPYKCDKCDAAFAHHSNLIKHNHIHTGKYPFRCNICNHGFSRLKAFTVHENSHYRSSLSKYVK